ncbi:streptogrisin B/streptogrisin C [Saccharothrix saharensis]|uniref:Streptogrisin B/streptogrisin C n=1 Tax=Saccharothrix saharensis TaxID=571190 RepID=A0A543J7B3_9PSEU|nr:S1 family peptidase [Saccharothrix saharensis]TQM78707.1 streptogrisin B/streptogrisin C [Saccharothrix saharensis]
MTFARRVGAAVLAAGLVLASAGPVSSAPATGERLERGAASRPAAVTGWYADPATEALVVSVHGDATGVAEWARGLGVGAVTVEHVAEAPRPVWDLIGGQPITSGGTRCTLGFNARSGANRFILSAGHCVATGSEWHGVGGYIGPAVGSSFPADDYGLIRVASTAAVSTPLIDRHASGPDVTITGSTTPPVGSSVCYSSPVVGWRCGGVTGLNQTVCYPQGCVSGLIRTSMCPEAGASGAPVVTNPGSGSVVRAVGLVSGGSGSCTSGGTTWVQPISEPLAVYGLTLHTG